ncbi:MAG: PorV/PorQ family protein [Candidatus Kapabacteria bacterium]|nr:PorV/PorQ family protein [Candidatus Kapabacteria bacterium]
MSDGGFSEVWLSRNIGARPIAMGGVYSAIVNEPSGIFYNPAGTAFMPNAPTFNTSVSSIGLGRTHASLAWAQEILPHFGVGAGVNNLYSGSFTGRNVQGTPTRDLNNNHISAMVSGAYRLEYFSMGASVKYINNSLNGANISANGFAMDLGVKLNVLDLFSFGLAMNNLFGSMNWNTASSPTEEIPFTIRTGVAAEFGLNEETIMSRTSITGEEELVTLPPTRYILLGLDAVMNQFDATPSFIIGAEIVPHEFIAIRGGIAVYGSDMGDAKFLPMNYWGGGLSFRPPLDMDFNIHIDYSISNEFMTNDRIAHHVSLIFEL